MSAPAPLPWSAEMGLRPLGLAATREEAIALANELSHGRPCWVHNDAAGEDWFGAAGDWKRVTRARLGAR